MSSLRSENTVVSLPVRNQSKSFGGAAQAVHTPGVFPNTLTDSSTLRHVKFEVDGSTSTLWCFLDPVGLPNFTPGLLGDLLDAQAEIRTALAEDRARGEIKFRNFVLASKIPGVFNLGGDLALFAELIATADRERLTAYAYKCVDLVHTIHEGFGDGIETIGLVQGKALGGGFEAALSCHTLVAERSARFGLPEIMFNLFPGMGAFNFLSRRIGVSAAERMILGGRIYTAADLLEHGVVDIVAEDGEGVEAVNRFARESLRFSHARRAVREARQVMQPLTRAELIRMTDIWVDAALGLGADDLRRMNRLVAAQGRRHGLANSDAAD